MADFNPRNGVHHKYAREDFELPCRNCGRTVTEDSVKCVHCGTLAPGIYSECPKCHSKNYFWKHYGIHYSGALGGLLTLGPLGALFFGVKGRTEAECVCLDCGQGWMPFAFPGGMWNVTRKYKLKNDSSQKSGGSKVISSSVNVEKIKHQKEINRQEKLREQANQRAIKERQRKEARTKRRTFIIFAIIIICIAKFVSIQINLSRDDWKIAYDKFLTPNGLYEQQQFIQLEDMNNDGIPELINFSYNEEGGYSFKINTYLRNSNLVATIYREDGAIPCRIGRRIEVYSGNEKMLNTAGYIVKYICRMKGDDIDYDWKDIDYVPEPVGLIEYEESDILSGAYKDKKANFTYLSVPKSTESESWDFDLETAYQILSDRYTPEEVYDTIHTRIKENYSDAGRDFLRFDAELLGYTGEVLYDREQSIEEQEHNYLSWMVYNIIDEKTLVRELDLEPMYYDSEFVYYDWENCMEVRVKYYQNATKIYFYLYN